MHCLSKVLGITPDVVRENEEVGMSERHGRAVPPEEALKSEEGARLLLTGLFKDRGPGNQKAGRKLEKGRALGT